MSLTVKAYLQKAAGGEPEIRRFSVDQDVSSSYTYLNKKITQAFPHLNDKAYELYWKDPENDYITFSSDEELLDALGFISDGTLRVQVREKSDGDDGIKTRCCKRQVLHPGVTCDSCEGPVCGIRYKCSVCPDYDLCMGCKGTGLHGDHEMITIPLPRRSAMRRKMASMFGHLDPRHAGASETSQTNNADLAEGSEGGPSGPEDFNGHPTWAPWMRRNWSRWWKDTHGDQCPPWKKGGKCNATKDGEKKGEDKTEPASQSGANGQEGFAHSADNYARDCEEKVTRCMENIAKDLEEGVAALLQQSNGEVEENGETSDKESQGYFQGPYGPWPWMAAWGLGGGGPGPVKSQRQKSEAAQNEEKATKADQPQSEKDAEISPAASVGGANKSAGQENTDKKTPESPDKEWAVIGDITQHIVPKPSNSNHGNDADSTRDPTPAGGARLYPQVEPLPEHSNPKITQALVQLGTMGFHNEGGWLTRLLEVVDGDINRVLDTIKANKH